MKLVWTHQARRELETIKQDSVGRWGLIVAAQYLSDIRDGAKLVAANPSFARPVKDQFHIYRVRSH
jgi:plasmid stabilization system protein ParE